MSCDFVGDLCRFDSTELTVRADLDLYHIISWPQLSYVAEDHKGRVVGYILAKMFVQMPRVTTTL
jgi:hypothetical protein